MISEYEKQYIGICKDILKNGYYNNNRTGVSTYKLPHQIITVNLGKEFPILKSKFVAFKSCVKEILWIMSGSNNINNLDSHIWDEWANEDGSIGKCYGYQIKKFNQIDNLINTLKSNNQDRRMMINLWNWEDLPEMNLAPCCYNSLFDVTDGKLNCMLIQRSGDLPLGVPFNTTQYAVLTHILAKLCGLQVGKLTHVINNAHIYENQVEGIKKQIKNYDKLYNCEETIKKDDVLSMVNVLGYEKFKELTKITEEDISSTKDVREYIPQLQLNIEDKEFKDITYEDVSLNGYSIKYGNMGKIDMPVSI